jgi:hypothetical protein
MEVSDPNLTNILILRTSFWHPCMHETWVTGGTFCTSVSSPWHLNICPLLTSRLVSRQRRNWFQVSNTGVTACFASASAASRLPDKCFVSGQKRWLSLGPILPTGLVAGYGGVAGWVWTILPRVHIVLWFRFFGPFKKHLALNLFATDGDVKQAVTSWLQTRDRFFLRRNGNPPPQCD